MSSKHAKRTEAALRKAVDAGSIAEAQANAPAPVDQGIASVEVWGSEGAREVADWYAAYAEAGYAALLSPSLVPNGDEDDAAYLFTDFAAASARGLTRPRAVLASMRRCHPAETALGVVRLVAERFPGPTWIERARAVFAESESMAAHVRKVLAR